MKSDMNKIGFLEEAPGHKSITRAMFCLIIIAALFIAIVQVWRTGQIDIPGFISMTSTACGLKLWQKSMEVKIPQQ